MSTSIRRLPGWFVAARDRLRSGRRFVALYFGGFLGVMAATLMVSAGVPAAAATAVAVPVGYRLFAWCFEKLLAAQQRSLLARAAAPADTTLLPTVVNGRCEGCGRAVGPRPEPDPRRALLASAAPIAVCAFWMPIGQTLAAIAGVAFVASMAVVGSACAGRLHAIHAAADALIVHGEGWTRRFPWSELLVLEQLVPVEVTRADGRPLTELRIVCPRTSETFTLSPGQRGSEAIRDAIVSRVPAERYSGPLTAR